MTETRIKVETFRASLGQGSPNLRRDGMDAVGSCAAAEPFALQVTDISMEPEFPKGCIIIVDPAGVVRDGAYVLAVDDKDEYIFRQLRINAGVYQLVALNATYGSITISGMERIQGVITQRAGRRRVDRKRYA